MDSDKLSANPALVEEYRQHLAVYSPNMDFEEFKSMNKAFAAAISIRRENLIENRKFGLMVILPSCALVNHESRTLLVVNEGTIPTSSLQWEGEI